MTSRDCFTIDANVVLRIVLGDISSQQDAALSYIEKHQVVIPILTVYESIYVLETVYEWDREQITDSMRLLLNHENIQAQAESLVRSSLRAFQANQQLSFADCILSKQTQMENCQLATFDQKLAGQGGEHVQLLAG